MAQRVVEFVVETPVRISPIATKTYPVGWRGPIDEDVARQALDMGLAIDPNAVATPVEADAGTQPPPGGETPPATVWTTEDLDGMKVGELRILAQSLGIAGAVAMRKADLVSAIVATSPPAATDPA
jgi:hypothetical protein